MSRIEAVDPDAILLLAFFLLMLVACGAYLLAERITRRRKWPSGHGATYWTTPRRVSDE